MMRSDEKPFIPRDLLMRNKSCGGVLGLVFNRSLTDRESVSFADARVELERLGAIHSASGRNAWSGLSKDAFRLGLIPKTWMDVLELDVALAIEQPDLEGVTHNDSGPTRRIRYLYERRPGDPMLIVDVVRKRIHRDTMKLLKDYVGRKNTQTKSEAARRLRGDVRVDA